MMTRRVGWVCCLVAASAFSAAPAGGQTIRGTLLDGETDRPIALGLIILMTEARDSITSTVTDEGGFFSVSSADPGSFVLLSSAWGYLDTWAGVFELGEGGEMTIEFRVGPRPLPVDSVTVSVPRRGLSLNVVESGFVRRLQRGFGHFITPYEIENSPAAFVTDLVQGVPGVAVQPGGYVGDQIMLRTAGSLCEPAVYLDGMRINVGQMGDVNALVPMTVLEAVEIYTRPSEIPVEYSAGGYGAGDDGPFEGPCGVILLWTRG